MEYISNKEASKLFFKILEEESPNKDLIRLFSDGKGFDVDIMSSPQYKISLIKEAFDKFIIAYNKEHNTDDKKYDCSKIDYKTDTSELWTLVKMTDDKFNGVHPFGIDEGYTQKALLTNKPIIGNFFYFGSLRTSTVKEILSDYDNEIVFKTINSTYKLTKNS